VSSSGLIYAGIVGAWAVYLVPVWLRREEQLNEARKKARYAAAIRTLGRTEQFERRWVSEEALAATGTDGPLRPPGDAAKSAQRTKPARPGQPADKQSKTTTKTAGPAAAKKTAAPQTSNRRPQPAAGKATSATERRPQSDPGAGSDFWRPAPAGAADTTGTSAALTAAADQQRHRGVTARIPHPHHEQRTPTTAAQLRQQAQQVRHRGVLLMRRRRVVAFLFTLATAGAGVSAVLGATYIWAMLVPAALFSVYIFNIRRDERLRAAERYRRRQAALAAERRRERDRDRHRLQAEAAATTVAQAESAPPQTRRRPEQRPQNPQRGPAQSHPEDFRRAANG